jgi:hypothetical protein
LEGFAPEQEVPVVSKSLEGMIPESCLCVDCGFNTAPGLSNRAELEQAFAAVADDERVEQSITAQSEVYTVRNMVWQQAGMQPVAPSRARHPRQFGSA